MHPLILALSMLALWMSAAMALNAYGAHRDKSPDGAWDAVVVAGFPVMPDGSQTPTLASRTARAVALWKEGIAPKIVLTGGSASQGLPEAAVAADYARSLGVPDDALIVEARSQSTDENARFSHELLGATRVVVVSDGYHLFRCERVFRRFFQEVRSVRSPTEQRLRLLWSMREVVAIAWYAVTGRLW